MAETCQHREILLVEDDSVDAAIFQRVLRDIGVTGGLTHVIDGQQALTYLKSSNSRKPRVIFLDLNMPRMTGTEFLELRSFDEELKDIPVVVLTTSSGREDMIRSLELGAVAYIIKCLDYTEFRRKIAELQRYFGPAEPPVEVCDGSSRKEAV